MRRSTDVPPAIVNRRATDAQTDVVGRRWTDAPPRNRRATDVPGSRVRETRAAELESAEPASLQSTFYRRGTTGPSLTCYSRPPTVPAPAVTAPAAAPAPAPAPPAPPPVESAAKTSRASAPLPRQLPRRWTDDSPTKVSNRAGDVTPAIVKRRPNDGSLDVALRSSDVVSADLQERPPDALQTEMRRIVENIYGPPQLRVPGLEIGRAYLNAWRENFRYGGDVIDVFHYGKGLTSLAMVDISGHGIDAAMYAGLTKHALRAYASRGFSARKCVRALNRLCIDNSLFEAVDDFFATVFFAIVDSQRLTIEYVSAGHEAAFLIEPNQSVQLATTGPVIGLPGDPPLFEHSVVKISEASILAAVTDGFSESRNARGDFLGAESVIDVIQAMHSGDAVQQAEALTRRAFDFAEGHLHDDVAALVVKLQDPA